MATKSFERLIDEFNRLPGIGRKSATRLVFHVLEMSDDEITSFTKAMKDVKEQTKRCKICDNFCEEELCTICNNVNRDARIICVVEDPKDIISLEKSGTYNGVYHVLNGKIAPLDGVTPDKLNIKSLLERIAKEEVKEVILALNPDLEGDTTTMYLSRLLQPFEIKITKIASGIPVGGNIEYADSATLSKALNSRQDV